MKTFFDAVTGTIGYALDMLLFEYRDKELINMVGRPYDYEKPQYTKGFAPGTWAGANQDHCLYTDINLVPDVIMSGRSVEIDQGERVMVIARPGWGNPWKNAHLGVVYVLVPRIQRCGWMWAVDLVEDES
jgi:hypothetical protein